MCPSFLELPSEHFAGTLELKATAVNTHSDWVLSVAFNPVDGKTIVSGAKDNTIKVWELRPFVDSEWSELTVDGSDSKATAWLNTVTGACQWDKPSGAGMH